MVDGRPYQVCGIGFSPVALDDWCQLAGVYQVHWSQQVG